MFDLLTRKPEVKLTKKERVEVKTAARELLEVLKAEKLTLDWRKRQQSRAAVRVTIEQFLDQRLPEVYTQEVFAQKCQAVYQHVYEKISEVVCELPFNYSMADGLLYISRAKAQAQQVPQPTTS